MNCMVIDIENEKMNLKEYIQYVCETSFEGAAQSYFERFGVQPEKVFRKKSKTPGKYTFCIALPPGYKIPGNGV